MSKAYTVGKERIHALNDVSLEVFPGEMIGIVGRTGTGKSTLMHVLGALQRPDSGQVRIDDQDMAQLEAKELAKVRAEKIGFLFQAFNILPNETVLGNVEVSLVETGVPPKESRRKALEALNIVGLGNRLEHTPNQLPPRARQYMALARALVNDPAVIIADEPTRPLDTTFREEMMGLFQKLNDEGRTIIISTPEASVANYCRRVVKMAQGQTVSDELVPKRRVVSQSGLALADQDGDVAEGVAVCPRCNYGNPVEDQHCQRCKFILHLTEEDELSIKGRLSGTESRWLGVESISDEGEVPGQDLVEELRDVSFLAGLGSKSLVKVVPALEPLSFSRGSTIVNQGDPADSFYIVRSGDVQVVMERQGKLAAPIASLGPRDGFGEMAILSEQPNRSFTIMATTDVELWRLPKEEFKALLAENLSLSMYFNRVMVQRLMSLQEKVFL